MFNPISLRSLLLCTESYAMPYLLFNCSENNVNEVNDASACRRQMPIDCVTTHVNANAANEQLIQSAIIFAYRVLREVFTDARPLLVFGT